MAEWHSKMEKVRLEDVRLKRDIDRLKQQLKFHENLLKKHEAEVLMLEEDKVRGSWLRKTRIVRRRRRRNRSSNIGTQLVLQCTYMQAAAVYLAAVFLPPGATGA